MKACIIHTRVATKAYLMIDDRLCAFIDYGNFVVKGVDDMSMYAEDKLMDIIYEFGRDIDIEIVNQTEPVIVRV